MFLRRWRRTGVRRLPVFERSHSTLSSSAEPASSGARGLPASHVSSSPAPRRAPLGSLRFSGPRTVLIGGCRRCRAAVRSSSADSLHMPPMLRSRPPVVFLAFAPLQPFAKPSGRCFQHGAVVLVALVEALVLVFLRSKCAKSSLRGRFNWKFAFLYPRVAPVLILFYDVWNLRLEGPIENAPPCPRRSPRRLLDGAGRPSFGHGSFRSFLKRLGLIAEHLS